MKKKFTEKELPFKQKTKAVIPKRLSNNVLYAKLKKYGTIYRQFQQVANDFFAGVDLARIKLPMKLQTPEGKVYVVKRARPTGGKAGKGNNVTSTIQVMFVFVPDAFMLIKEFRYKTGDSKSELSAIIKATTYVLGVDEAKKILIQ